MTIIDGKDRFVWHGEPLPEEVEQEVFDLTPVEQMVMWLDHGVYLARSDGEEQAVEFFRATITDATDAYYTLGKIQTLIKGENPRYMAFGLPNVPIVRLIGNVQDTLGRRAIADVGYKQLPQGIQGVSMITGRWVSTDQINQP